MRNHHPPIKMAKMKNSGNTKCWWGCGNTGSLIHCWHSHLGKQFGCFFKTKHGTTSRFSNYTTYQAFLLQKWRLMSTPKPIRKCLEQIDSDYLNTGNNPKILQPAVLQPYHGIQLSNKILHVCNNLVQSTEKYAEGKSQFQKVIYRIKHFCNDKIQK